MKKRAKPTLENRNHPLWGKCEKCGYSDLLNINVINGRIELYCIICNEDGKENV